MATKVSGVEKVDKQYPQYYKWAVEVWLDSQSVENNTSNLIIQWYVGKIGGGANFGGGAACGFSLSGGGMTINETTYPERSYMQNNSWRVLGSVTRTVPHGTDGSLSISYSASFTHNPSQGGAGADDLTGSFTLPTIPRASQISITGLTDNAVTVGDGITVATNRASDSFRHNIAFSANGKTLSYDFSTASFAFDTGRLYDLCIDDTTITATLTTYAADGAAIGSTSQTFIAKNYKGVEPSVDEGIGVLTVSCGNGRKIGEYIDPDEQTFDIVVYLTGISTLSVDASYIVPGNNRTISKVEIAGTEAKLENGYYTVKASVPFEAGEDTAPVFVTNDLGIRKQLSSETNDIVQSYFAPRMQGVNVNRCNDQGALDSEGEKVKVTWSALTYKDTFQVDQVEGEYVQNSCTVKYKLDNGAWTDLPQSGIISGIDKGSAYTVSVAAFDLATTTDHDEEAIVTALTVPVAFDTFYLGHDGRSVGIGRVATGTDTFEVGFTTVFYGNVKIDDGNGNLIDITAALRALGNNS